MAGFKISVGSTVITATSTANALRVYNCLVDIVRVAKTNTASGLVEAPVTLVTLMAHIKWRRGSEKVLAAKETHYLDATLHCRKPAGVTIETTDKVVYNGKTYEIVDVYDLNNLGRLLVIELRKLE